MKYNIQHELELRKFESVSRFLSSLDGDSLRHQLFVMMQVHNIVLWDEQIPSDIKEEIIVGIAELCGDYQPMIENIQDEAREQIERMMEYTSPQKDFKKAINDYKAVYKVMKTKYLDGEISLQNYCDIQVAFGDLERNLHAMEKNIENNFQ